MAGVEQVELEEEAEQLGRESLVRKLPLPLCSLALLSPLESL